MGRQIDPAFLARPGISALAADMARHGTEREAPARAVAALLGDRWTTLILMVLAQGEWRHAELRRVLSQLSAEQAISQRVLTLKLRALERDGFVLRTASADVPPKVSYRLTALGDGLACQARQLIAWTNDHSGPIRQARSRFDSARD